MARPASDGGDSVTTYNYKATDEDPSIALEWKDRDGNVIDLSTATFSVLLVDVNGTTAVTKTQNVTGASTSPNVVISWDAGELAALSGQYKLIVQATVSSRQRTFRAGNYPIVLVSA